ncbi:MAG: hypothetical protein ABEJ82_00215 [Haloplanus sp.]
MTRDTDTDADATTATDGDARIDTDGGAAPDDGGPVSRRTLIRLLVGLGVGIPILVEGLTFLGLVGQKVGGDDEGGTTATPTETGVAVGEDLLPSTDRHETLVSAVLRQTSGRWKLSLTVEVENTGDAGYEVELGAVHTHEGRRVDGGTTTGRLAPGETKTVTGEWDIPAGSTPAAVDVTSLVYGDGDVERRNERVRLAKIPVRGS